MKRCSICVNPVTRPNTFFDKKNICQACKFSSENFKYKIDWKKRDNQLKRILNWAAKKKTSVYDCIVTVSGGKDSVRQAFFARDELGLNPLLVSVQYPPEHLRDRGAKNLDTLIKAGFTTYTMSLNPQLWKSLIKETFFKNGNIFNTTEMALYAIPIHFAIDLKIPLVFLGENPSHTLGEKHGGKGANANNMYLGNTLNEARRLFSNINTKSPSDKYFYNYPSPNDMKMGSIKIFYLGYFIKDWSGTNNAKFAIERGLDIRSKNPEEIGDLWGFTGLDENFRIVNQYLKFLKFGFGHVTDQVQEMIHANRITRSDGLKLIEKYDGKISFSYIDEFCNYLEISHESFFKIANRYKNEHIFHEKVNKKNFNKLKYTVDG